MINFHSISVLPWFSFRFSTHLARTTSFSEESRNIKCFTKNPLPMKVRNIGSMLIEWIMKTTHWMSWIALTFLHISYFKTVICQDYKTSVHIKLNRNHTIPCRSEWNRLRSSTHGRLYKVLNLQLHNNTIYWLNVIHFKINWI